MAKFQSETKLSGYDGEIIKKPDGDKEPFVLRDVLTMACVNADPRTHASGEEKLKIYRILQKVSKKGEIELSSEEVTLLKKLIAGSFGVVIVGPAYDLLEQKSKANK